MYDFAYSRATSVADAAQKLKQEDAKLVAGGMTLLPTIKLRLNKPSTLIDLMDLKDLVGISVTGDAVTIVMADGSDDPEDVVAYQRLLAAGYDCAFGSRFMTGSRVSNYPRFKFVVNRLVNLGIRLLFGHGYNDTTNAFKAYRREVIENVQPLLSHHFNLTVELPLKAVVRGHSYAITPISWRNRKTGLSQLHLQEMGSRYAFIILSVFLEHHLSRGDYRRPDVAAPTSRSHWRAGRPAAHVIEPPQPLMSVARPVSPPAASGTPSASV